MKNFQRRPGPVPPEAFADRTDLRAEASEWLSSSRPQLSVWYVEGPRDQGKTSFGDWCAHTAAGSDDWLPVVVRFDDPDLSDQPRSEEILERILWTVRGKAYDSGLKVSWHRLQRGAALSFDFLTSAPFIRHWVTRRPFATTTASLLLKRLKRVTQNRECRVLLILDEVEIRPQIPLRVAEFASKVAEDPDDLVRLIVLGLPGWRSDLPVQQNPAKFGRLLELPPFSAPDIGDFIEAYLGDRDDVNAAPGSSAALLKFTGGIPSLLQTLCADALDIALEEGNEQVTWLNDRHIRQAAQFGSTVRSRGRALLEYSSLSERIWADDPDRSRVANVLVAVLPAFAPGIKIADARREVQLQCGDALAGEVFDEVLSELVDSEVAIAIGPDEVALRCGLFKYLLPEWI